MFGGVFCSFVWVCCHKFVIGWCYPFVKFVLQEKGTHKQMNASFKSFFLQVHDSLYRTLYRMVGNQQEAEDLMQEAFVKLHDHWDEIEDGKHKAWLFQVATRLGLNALRNEKRRSRWHREAAEQDSTGGTQPVGDPATQMAVRRVLSTMPERQSRLLLLHMAGLSHDELAQAMEVKKASISQLLLRSKKAFENVYATATC